MIQSNKKHLNVVNQNNNAIMEGSTCFSVHAKYGVNCQRKQCPNWISHAAGHNCVMIAAGNGSHTLQEIGQIYGLTRMRICQIEKSIYEKIRNASHLSSDFLPRFFVDSSTTFSKILVSSASRIDFDNSSTAASSSFEMPTTFSTVSSTTTGCSTTSGS